MVAIVNVCMSYKLDGIENIRSAVGSSLEGFDVVSPNVLMQLPSEFMNVLMQLRSTDRGNNKAHVKVFCNGSLSVVCKNRRIADATIAALASSLSETAGRTNATGTDARRVVRIKKAMTKIHWVTGVAKGLLHVGDIAGWMMAAHGSEPRMLGNAVAYKTPLGRVAVHGTKATIMGRDEDGVAALDRLIRYGPM